MRLLATTKSRIIGGSSPDIAQSTKGAEQPHDRVRLGVYKTTYHLSESAQSPGIETAISVQDLGSLASSDPVLTRKMIQQIGKIDLPKIQRLAKERGVKPNDTEDWHIAFNTLELIGEQQRNLRRGELLNGQLLQKSMPLTELRDAIERTQRRADIFGEKWGRSDGRSTMAAVELHRLVQMRDQRGSPIVSNPAIFPAIYDRRYVTTRWITHGLHFDRDHFNASECRLFSSPDGKNFLQAPLHPKFTESDDRSLVKEANDISKGLGLVSLMARNHRPPLTLEETWDWKVGRNAIALIEYELRMRETGQVHSRAVA